MSDSLEVYPSTLDRPIAGGQDGPLMMMIGARQRLVRGHTALAYIMPGRSEEGIFDPRYYVCAVGALWAEQGLLGEQILCWSHRDKDTLRQYLIEENMLKEDTLVAMKLLDEAALEFVPESKDCSDVWIGPLEWVNQCWDSGVTKRVTTSRAFSARKEKILEIYDYAIAMRQYDLSNRMMEDD